MCILQSDRGKLQFIHICVCTTKVCVYSNHLNVYYLEIISNSACRAAGESASFLFMLYLPL